ncbi:MAG TPA: glycoside hydrolase family 76 protein [Candidatus Brocadiia bacterium]|nr:glycoside hydrolase family 76 protein [Candidatus Brocadiia bacterium]
MKFASLAVIAAQLLCPAAIYAAEPSSADGLQTAARMRARGSEIISKIRSQFLIPDKKLYSDEWSRNGGQSGPAFAWGAGVMLSALNGAAKADPEKCQAWLNDYIKALDVYWNSAGPVPGYDCLTCPKPVDRYYDDNAWIVIALAEAHKNSGNESYFNRAERAMDYVLSGMDDKLGGGIYWRESDKASKNTCSNAPSAVAGYLLYRTTGEDDYRRKGDAILDWTLANLRDPQDGLMWDNIKLDGTVDKTKFSYNTALTIRALAIRSTIETDPARAKAWLDMARQSADSALKTWQVPDTGAFKGASMFAHLLAESLLELGAVTGERKYTDAVIRAVEFVAQRNRDAEGNYPENWDDIPQKPLEKCKLIHAASAARACFVLADALAASEIETMNPSQTAGRTKEIAGEWALVNEHAAFSIRDTAEDVIYDGKMWLSNGYYNGNILTRDLWNTTDGIEWKLINKNTPYDGYSEMVAYDGRMWAIKGSVWTSRDGVDWKQVAEKTPFGVRSYGETLVFKNKIWQLGSGRDVWNTSDCVNWECVRKEAPFGGRAASAVVAFKDKLWLLGGRTSGVNNPPEKGYKDMITHNDVWCSSDGKEWNRVLEHAPWKPRQWFIAMEYKGRMWIIGGHDNVNSANFGDVWHTENGVNWVEFKSPKCFSARHEPTCYIFNGSLWVVAGNSWPLMNDVWRLTLP